MKYCFAHWDEIAGRIARAPGFFLALDYDGVLSPIAARPGLASMPPENKRLLARLARRKNVKLAIVSGRSLDDIHQRVQLKDLTYAGNHGAEIKLGEQVERHIPIQIYRDHLVETRYRLIQFAQKFPGTHIEDKGFGLGLHYRELTHPRLAALHRQFKTWSKALPADLHVTLAKMIYEIRPNVAWDKGNAVQRIWQQVAPEALPICLGDDLTDEDGFRALKGKGINIFVGDKDHDSAAEYFLRSTRDVTTFLRRLARLPPSPGARARG